MKKVSITEILGVKEYERFDIVDINPETTRIIKVIYKNAYVDSSSNICDSTDDTIDGETICRLITGGFSIVKTPKITPYEATLFSRAGVRFITRNHGCGNHQLIFWSGKPNGNFGQYEAYSTVRSLGVLPTATLPNIQPGECIEVTDWLET